MGEQLWTPEPWECGEGYSVIGGDGKPIFTRQPHPDKTKSRPENVRDANRQRIVACVNALAGIPTPPPTGAVAALAAAAQGAAYLLRKLGGTNHDPEYSELVAALAAFKGE